MVGQHFFYFVGRVDSNLLGLPHYCPAGHQMQKKNVFLYDSLYVMAIGKFLANTYSPPWHLCPLGIFSLLEYLALAQSPPSKIWHKLPLE